MTNQKNYINGYFVRYNQKISGLTNNKAKIDIGRYYGNYALAQYEGVRNTSGQLLLNPEEVYESFWLGSVAPLSEYERDTGHEISGCLWACSESGEFFENDNYDGGGYGGIRPVLIISY